mmetsp:Transcript_52819/g.77351  ORF Transcript_52819/g.77351 Transcript_52819/m.77351 type:complete len:215 (+) Transcript_52819:259-903(+)
MPPVAPLTLPTTSCTADCSAAVLEGAAAFDLGLRQSFTYLSRSFSVALSSRSMSISISSLLPTTLERRFLMISTTLPSFSCGSLLILRLRVRLSSKVMIRFAFPPPDFFLEDASAGFLTAGPLLFTNSRSLCICSIFRIISAIFLWSAAVPPPPPGILGVPVPGESDVNPLFDECDGALGSRLMRFSEMSFNALAHSCTSVPGGLKNIALSKTR